LPHGENPSTLEPLGAQERREQVDEQENRRTDGEQYHGGSLLDAFARGQEGEHQSHRDEPQGH
jgi:hypothetical protein